MSNIRLATLGDLAAYKKVSIDTFIEAYEDKNTESDIKTYTSTFFTNEMIENELIDPTRTIFLTESSNEIAGYVKLANKPIPQCTKVKTAIEISRIYVRKKYYGSGLAQELLNKAVEFASNKSVSALYLAVWQENKRAIAFYQKCGFTICGETTFDWGTGKIDEDWWMVKTI